MRASGLPARGLPLSSQGTELCADTVKARNICMGTQLNLSVLFGVFLKMRRPPANYDEHRCHGRPHPAYTADATHV